MKRLIPVACLFAFHAVALAQEASPKTASAVLVIQGGHAGEINNVRINSNASVFLSGSDDGTLILWDSKSGRQLFSFEGYIGDLSEDGQLIAAVTEDHTVSFWDAQTGQLINSFNQPALNKHRMTEVALNANGSLMVAGDKNHTATLWKTKSGKHLRSFTGHSAAISCVDISDDGHIIATGSEDKSVILWDSSTGEQLHKLMQKSQQTRAQHVALSGDGQFVLASFRYGHVLWDTAKGHKIKTYPGTSIGALNTNGGIVLTANHDHSATLWDRSSDNSSKQFVVHKDKLRGADLNEKGDLLATCSWNDEAVLWDVLSQTQLKTFGTHRVFVHDFDISQKGEYLATGNTDNSSVIWDLSNGNTRQILSGNDNYINGVSLSNDGRKLLTGPGIGHETLWDTTTGKRIRSFSNLLIKGRSRYAFSHSGTKMISANADKALLVDVRTGTVQREITFKEHYGLTSKVIFSDDDQVIVTGLFDGTTIIWNASSGRQTRTVKGHKNKVNSVALNADGKILATGSEDKTVIVWDTTTGKQLRKIEDHTDAITDVVLNDNGKILVTASKDGTVKLWSVISGEELRRFEGHTRSSPGIVLSQDGCHLVTGTKQGTLKIWDVQSGNELCQMMSFDKGKEWLVITPDGLFDGSPGAMSYVSYRQPKTNKLIPLKKYQDKYYTAGLLPLVLKGNAPKVDLPANRFVPEG